MASIGGVFGNSYFDSVSGLQDANLRLNVSANNVANANTNGFQPDWVESVAEKTGGVRGVVFEANAGILHTKETSESQTDYATEVVNLTLARRAFDANLQALKSQQAADQAVTNIVG
jgi:flagellar hook protein FlgE